MADTNSVVEIEVVRHRQQVLREFGPGNRRFGDAASAVSAELTPSSTSIPPPMSAILTPSTVTEARVTRCKTTRMFTPQ